MGILKGTNHHLALFESLGRYDRRAASYNVNVDGELFRYKGLVAESTLSNNPEEAIARQSVRYLLNCVRQVECLLGRTADNVLVYMDGKRVENKASRTQDHAFDVGVMRTLFIEYCKHHAMTVINLIVGESELQMYKHRDTSKGLNVFLTNDSDLMSICYEHEVEPSADDPGDETGPIDERSVFWDRCIQDRNEFRRCARDSCLWIKCNAGGNHVAIGFDDIAKRALLGVKQYRVLVALSGTDFTPYLFTDSMVCGVVSIVKAAIDERGDDDSLPSRRETSDRYAERCAKDVAFVNSLTDTVEISVALLFLAVRGGGQTMKPDRSAAERRDVEELRLAVDVYLAYVSRGVMPFVKIPNAIRTGALTRTLLDAMQGTAATASNGTRRTKGQLRKWSTEIGIEGALENYRRWWVEVDAVADATNDAEDGTRSSCETEQLPRALQQLCARKRRLDERVEKNRRLYMSALAAKSLRKNKNE